MVKERHYQAGEVIIKEKDHGETAFIIKRGRVRVTKEANGKTTHICDIEAGNIFGEMSMIDEKPRSATVTAIEDTVLREIHRDSFFTGLKNEHEIALKILKVLFERLRKANVLISQLNVMESQSDTAHSLLLCDMSSRLPLEITMEGLTRPATKSLPEHPLLIRKFPFLVGRKTKDPLVYNDLKIPDKQPYRISRHHLELDHDDGRLFALDRGSHLGSIVDGRQLGGPEGNLGPLFFEESTGILVLGDERSPYQYRLSINTS
ncbi:MAG: cyclic nucleotide-binding domain-containing protein [Deltaproteobacteria bacterium]|nr:cyclic nucleotide-binding domain-containing protein [Deltaproteobacteria bacterium]